MLLSSSQETLNLKMKYRMLVREREKILAKTLHRSNENFN